jgi:23S rRNA (uracil1939-C5)-methyltransferase
LKVFSFEKTQENLGILLAYSYLCSPNKINMARKKKPLPLLEGVVIEAVAAEGRCLFHWEELVVFVPFCVPGDICDVQIRRKKHSFAEGEVVRFIKYSNVRATPFCSHFGVCGGCKWQNLPYEEQLKFKQQQVFDQLTRIGKIELPEFHPILGSVKTQAYRNKLDFGCANKRYLTKEEIEEDRVRYKEIEDNSQSLKNNPAIGFHITGAFDKILPIEKCWLMDDLHNQIRNEIRDYACQNGISFFDLRAQTGLLRDVIIRNSNTGEWMVIVQFCLPQTPSNEKGSWEDENGKKALAMLQHIADKFRQISSLLYLDNQKCNDTIGDQDILIFKGNDHIFETMEDLRFKVGPKSFYQTNTEQAYHLYSVAREFAFATLPDSSESPELPLVYDLYTGTGTIANFVARKAQKVIGIEYVPEAIEDAKVNSEINGIDNTLFFAGDMKDILNDEFIAEHGRPDVIITDPPRAGMHPDVIKTILHAAPQRIVYVSCNPATQARDLQALDCQYRVMAVQPVDMFPHTPHVENVVLLSRR